MPIDYSVRSPDLMSYEVDHIIALDNGGPDILENKQASHRTCNRAKWNKNTTGPRGFVTWRTW
jgi:5-methylcytosine-specific restriction endonuclease McrA